MCGVFGIVNNRDGARLTRLGLFALQHRGQQSTGIGSEVSYHTGTGLVSEVLTDDVIKKIIGTVFVGHNRYPTAGDDSERNAQPLVMKTKYGIVKIVHNGNLTNALSLRRDLEDKGRYFITTADSEVILHLIDMSVEQAFPEALLEALSKIEGAYSLVMLFDDVLIGARDPLGFRPLVLGKLNSSWVLASESCALDIISALYVREVEPGEAVWIKGESLTSIRFAPSYRTAKCIFEHVYFSRPDSRVFDAELLTYHSEQKKREQMGRILWTETWQDSGLEADIVVGVPDSGMDAAKGFADASGIPLEKGLVRNHYSPRTFIDSKRATRGLKVRAKLNPVPEILKDKRVILIDDSIVRGTTSQEIVQMVAAAGAANVHMRVSSPPNYSSCFHGIDTPTRAELIAFRMDRNTQAIADYLRVDTLGYLSLHGLHRAVQARPNEYCDACFTANYPTKLRDFSAGLVEQ